MMGATWIVLRKEVVDNLRDVRSVLNALLYVLMNPLLFIIMFGFLFRTFSEQATATLELPVVGAANAPALVAYLEQQAVDVVPGPADPEAALAAGEVDVVLVIPEAYGERFREGEPATVQLLRDGSNESASVPLERTRTLLQRYSSQVGAMRLLARGISPALATPVVVEAVDVAQQTEAAPTLNLLPAVMLVAAFFGGYYLAMDITAGERERNALEPLLINPVPRWQIVLGKTAAIFVFALVGVLVATLIYAGLLALPQLQSFTGLRVELAWETVAWALLLMVPVTAMAVTLEMLLASYARSQKQAQTYVSYLTLVGFMPALFLSVLPIDMAEWMVLVPTIGQTMLIQGMTRGEGLDGSGAAIATAVTLAVAVAALWATVRVYNQERIVLGG